MITITTVRVSFLEGGAPRGPGSAPPKKENLQKHKRKQQHTNKKNENYYEKKIQNTSKTKAPRGLA